MIAKLNSSVAGIFLLLLTGVASSCGAQLGSRIFDASEFYQDDLKIGQENISDLLNQDVVLRGKIMRASGTPSLISGTISSESQASFKPTCLSLLIRNGAANFGDDKFLTSFEFLGRFVLLDSFSDPDTIYFTYKGISFTPNCQSSDLSRKSAYFLVSAFRKSGAATFVDVGRDRAN